MADAPDETYLLEAPVRLSQSRLWQWQRAFFNQQGVEAWRRAIVPQFITSNAFIAAAYAQVVFGWLRDLAARPDGLDPQQPIYLIELGSGSGRLAYHFLHEFWSFFPHSPLRRLRPVYVMTDLSPANIAFWRAHAGLAPWVAQGRLDFAQYDAEADQALTLLETGAHVPAAAPNPTVIIANYCFDGLRTDVFRFEHGTLAEARVRLTTDAPAPDPDDPALIGRAQVSYDYAPAAADYYADPACNALLADYQVTLSDTVLEFPVGALEALRGLRQLAPGQALLLTADRGYHRADDLDGRLEPALAIHGSFSMQVNYHALGRYVAGQGGQWLTPAQTGAELQVCAALWGEPPAGWAETRLAFRQAIERFGPDDYFALKEGVEANLATLDAGQVLAYVRLSGWDSARFLACFPTLLEAIKLAPEWVRAGWRAAAGRLWDNYYDLGEQQDMANNLGLLLYALDAYAEAGVFFERSLQQQGPDARTYCGLALCQAALELWPEAAQSVAQALALDADLAPAVRLAARLAARPAEAA